VLSLAVGLAQRRLVASWRGSPQQVKRWGGAALILVGIWLVLLAVWAVQFRQLLT